MEVAAGIYGRIMFPDVAVEADPHLSDLQKAMLDATPDCIKVVSVDGKLLMMNRAGCLALGVPEDSRFGMPWLPLLPDDVHAAGVEALRKAVAGRTARFPGRSTSTSGTVYWDNLLTPLVDAAGQVLSILCVSRDVTQKTLLEKELGAAIEREKLLAREMRHRVKNLLSVVLGLVSLSQREAKSAKTPVDATELLREKLSALSRASDAVFEQDHGGAEDADPVDIQAVVTSVLQPYGGHCTVIGSPASIRYDAITPFALFLHELATNAVKYGAFSKSDGGVTIRWTARDGMIDLTWIETGGPQISGPPERRGFGTEMVERVVRSAGGSINRTWRADGLVVDLHFPSSVTA